MLPRNNVILTIEDEIQVLKFFFPLQPGVAKWQHPYFLLFKVME
jgi:hypothetical protein